MGSDHERSEVSQWWLMMVTCKCNNIAVFESRFLFILAFEFMLAFAFHCSIMHESYDLLFAPVWLRALASMGISILMWLVTMRFFYIWISIFTNRMTLTMMPIARICSFMFNRCVDCALIRLVWTNQNTIIIAIQLKVVCFSENKDRRLQSPRAP